MKPEPARDITDGRAQSDVPAPQMSALQHDFLERGLQRMA